MPGKGADVHRKVREENDPSSPNLGMHTYDKQHSSMHESAITAIPVIYAQDIEYIIFIIYVLDMCAGGW